MEKYRSEHAALGKVFYDFFEGEHSIWLVQNLQKLKIKLKKC